MSTPDVTPVQKLGAALMILMGATWPLLSAFGHGLTDAQTIAVSGFVTAFVAVAVAADAIIRHGRSRVAAAAAQGTTVVVDKPKKAK